MRKFRLQCVEPIEELRSPPGMVPFYILAFEKGKIVNVEDEGVAREMIKSGKWKLLRDNKERVEKLLSHLPEEIVLQVPPWKIKPDSFLGRRGGMVPTVNLGPNTAETGESMSEHMDKEDLKLLRAENKRLKEVLTACFPVICDLLDDKLETMSLPGVSEEFHTERREWNKPYRWIDISKLATIVGELI